MQNDDQTQPIPNNPTPQPDGVQYSQEAFPAGQDQSGNLMPQPGNIPYGQAAFPAGQETNHYPSSQTTPQYNQAPDPAMPTQYSQTPFSGGYLPPNPGNFEQYGQPQAPVPARKNRLRLLIIGAVGVIVLLLLVIGGLLFLPGGVMAKNDNQAATVATPTVVPVVTPAASKNIYAPYLTQYGPTIRSQIAQGLNLSTDQLTTQLRSKQTLSQIATTQGVSNTQLQTLVTNTFQSNFQPAIASGNLTQKQVTALINRMLKQPKTLDLYLAASPKVKGAATPGTTPTPVS